MHTITSRVSTCVIIIKVLVFRLCLAGCDRARTGCPLLAPSLTYTRMSIAVWGRGLVEWGNYGEVDVQDEVKHGRRSEKRPAR